MNTHSDTIDPVTPAAARRNDAERAGNDNPVSLFHRCYAPAG